MNFYHYYQGDWKTGKKHLYTISANTITEADKTFQQESGIDPVRDKSITVTLSPLSIGS